MAILTLHTDDLTEAQLKQLESILEAHYGPFEYDEVNGKFALTLDTASAVIGIHTTLPLLYGILQTQKQKTKKQKNKKTKKQKNKKTKKQKNKKTKNKN
jgi:hypothetical protein